jgi:hypothetical protein
LSEELTTVSLDESNDVDLQTTLHVSTVFPTEAASSVVLEVATIRSPYSFDFEDGKSTRYAFSSSSSSFMDRRESHFAAGPSGRLGL